MSFVFYDTETTGIDTAFDQILQFGAIRTDNDLNEIERFEIRCRLLPHVVPSPGAMRVTGVTVALITDADLPSHYEMVRAIRAKMEEWSPAIFIGHNSLGFDEHLLRQALYKTLHPPYLTNTNGNCRTDSLRMIQAVAMFDPDALTIPTDSRGKNVFKLDRLAPANGFIHHDAHDAMGDVEATIHMCRLISERVPSHWSNFVRFAQKAAVVDFLNEEEFFLLADFYFGNPYSWLVTCIGTNPENNSEHLVFDLCHDPDELAALSDEELSARLSRRPKPVRSLRANAAPIILAFDDIEDEHRRSFPDEAEISSRAQRLNSDDALQGRLVAAYRQTREAAEPSPHVEKQIYDGFSSFGDQSRMDQFHGTEWPARAALIEQFEDERLRRLGGRLMHSEAAHCLPEATRQEYDTLIARRLMAEAGTVPWLTLPQAIADTHDLLHSAVGAERELLSDLLHYLNTRAEQANLLLV